MITANPGRLNEAVTYNDKMGNIKTLQRKGKITPSTYGLMDNLTYAYSGNRLTKVTDAVTTAITNPDAFHFVDGANAANEYAYDANGNITKDLNKKIASITYNSLNLPSAMTFSDGNTTTYGYDTAGSKLSVAYKSDGTTTKTEYVGNKVYKNGTLGMILTEEGYITLSGTTPTYYYYLKDHQGNNRVVLNQGGAVQQVNHYYPFGGIFGEGLQSSKQPYRYNGKELDRQWGLNMYDYGARHYDAAIGRWGQVDPLAEEYFGWSLYSYVGNNPINYIDPNGMFRTKFGAWLYKLFNGGEKILRDSGGEYFVSQQVEHPDDEAGITVRRTFDWNGRTEGKDLAFESEKNAYIAQMRFKEMALQHGFEYYETNNRSEAIAGLLSPISSVILPNPVLKTANSTINTGKAGIQGVKSLGAAGKGFSKTLQTGGHTLSKSTLKGLGLNKQQGKIAVEALKKDKGLAPNFHGKIMSNGDFVCPNSGQVLGNLFDYLY